jgi:hypothetical protein
MRVRDLRNPDVGALDATRRRVIGGGNDDDVMRFVRFAVRVLGEEGCAIGSDAADGDDGVTHLGCASILDLRIQETRLVCRYYTANLPDYELLITAPEKQKEPRCAFEHALQVAQIKKQPDLHAGCAIGIEASIPIALITRSRAHVP